MLDRRRRRTIANAARQAGTAGWLALADHFIGGIAAGFIGALIAVLWVRS